MIELRYVKILVPLYGSSVDFVRTGTKLQYRIQTNLLELGLQPPIWSDWIDVPTVNGESN